MTPTPPSILGETFTGADLMLLAFYILIGIYAIFTAILYYHWQTYSAHPKMNFVTFTTYFVITIPIILTLSATVAL